MRSDESKTIVSHNRVLLKEWALLECFPLMGGGGGRLAQVLGEANLEQAARGNSGSSLAVLVLGAAVSNCVCG